MQGDILSTHKDIILYEALIWYVINYVIKMNGEYNYT